MMTLMIYFIYMMPACISHNNEEVCDIDVGPHWEFVAIDYAPSAEYCRMEAGEIAKVFADQPGNMRILCVDDRRVRA